MGLQRASLLFPVNSTTVDSGAGIDIRLLDSVEAGATDSDQSVRWTHTQDGAQRTFNPDNTLVTGTLDPRNLQRLGWALRLTEDMTPDDDTNCDVFIPAQTITVRTRAALTWNGVQTGNAVITFRASLWRYDPSTDSGISIANGSQTNSWNVSLDADEGVYKNTGISITISDTTFSQGEILLLQIGAEGTTLPNPALGTTNYDLTLDVDVSTTNLEFGAVGGIHQTCSLASNITGKGSVSRGGMQVTQSDNIIGKGIISSQKGAVASKTFNLAGEGSITRKLAIDEDFNLIGKGIITSTKAVVASKVFDLVGKGTITRQLNISLPKNIIGKGVVSYTKSVIAFKSFNLIGKGLITSTKNVIASKTFNLIGEGSITRNVNIGITRTAIGEGEIISIKAAQIFKTFNLVGEGSLTKTLAIEIAKTLVGKGIITEVHPVQAFRTFNLVGKGIITGRIEIPIDELGEGAVVTVKRPIFIFDD